MARDDDMREVRVAEAGEGGEDPAPPGPPPTSSGPPAPAPVAGRPRRRRRVAAGLAAVLVVAGAATTDAHRERRDAARVAALPGLLAPVGPTLDVRWRRPVTAVHTTTPEGDPLVSTGTRRGDRALVRVDVTSGADVWTAPLPELGVTGDLSCVPLGEPPARTTERIACRLVTASEPMLPTGRRVAAGGRCLLVVLDAGTGRRLSERDLGDRWSTVAALGGDLLRVQMLPDRRVRVVREEPVFGRQRWAVTSTGAFGGVVPRRSEPVTPVPALEHGVVVTDGPVGMALSPDGSVLGEWHPVGTYSGDAVRLVDVSALPGGRLVVQEPLTRPPTVLVLDPGGTQVRFPGPVATPVVDDRSGPATVLTHPDGALVAVDARTARPVWSGPALGAVVRVDRRVVGTVPGGVVALDASTGRALWRADVPAGGRGQPLLTDGRVVLAPSPRSSGPRLVALGLDDGRTRWTAPVPSGITRYTVAAGHLLARTADELVALG